MAEPSKMQLLIDKARELNKIKYGSGGTREAVDVLIEAVVLIAQAQQQTMGDVEEVKREASRNYMGPIG